MIKSVIVTNHLGDSVELELTRPELSGFIVEYIDGLGPAKANVNITDIATYDGGLYNSSRLGTRNIVFGLKFMDGLKGQTIEDIRQKSYKFFPTKGNVTIRIITDNHTLETDGYVESNEPDIFSDKEGCKISVVCPYPYFYGVGEDQQFVFSGIEPMFEFPFSNESVTEPLLLMGEIKIIYEGLMVYKGDAETGIKITLHAEGPVENITIYNTGTRETMFIDTAKLAAITGSHMVAKDEIIINTVEGDKYIRLLRGGKYYNILNCINKNADWFQLSSGDNIFAYTAEIGKEDLRFIIENRVIYKGV